MRPPDPRQPLIDQKGTAATQNGIACAARHVKASNVQIATSLGVSIGAGV